MSPKTYPMMPIEIAHKSAKATAYHGARECYMCPFDHREPPRWECAVKSNGGWATMILCDWHGKRWINETKAKVIE